MKIFVEKSDGFYRYSWRFGFSLMFWLNRYKYWKIKNTFSTKKEPKIEICYQESKHNYIRKLQLAPDSLWRVWYRKYNGNAQFKWRYVVKVVHDAIITYTNSKQFLLTWRHENLPYRSAGKMTLTLFFDISRPVLVEWMLEDTTVSAAQYVNTLIRLHTNIKNW